MEVISNFDSGGVPLDKGTLTNGEGSLKIYDETGILIEVEHYKKGRLKKTEKIVPGKQA